MSNNHLVVYAFFAAPEQALVPGWSLIQWCHYRFFLHHYLNNHKNVWTQLLSSAVPQPFLLLIAANLALARFLGWKLSLWPVPTWFEVQWSKSVFFLIKYDSINYMKHLWTVCITTHPWHSHLCCWLLPIWPQLDVWAKYWAYGLCRLGWRYNGAKLSFSRYYMIVWMIRNTS